MVPIQAGCGLQADTAAAPSRGSLLKHLPGQHPPRPPSIWWGSVDRTGGTVATCSAHMSLTVKRVPPSAVMSCSALCRWIKPSGSPWRLMQPRLRGQERLHTSRTCVSSGQDRLLVSAEEKGSRVINQLPSCWLGFSGNHGSLLLASRQVSSGGSWGSLVSGSTQSPCPGHTATLCMCRCTSTGLANQTG